MAESLDEEQPPLHQASWGREGGWCCVKGPVVVVGVCDFGWYGVWKGLEEMGSSGISGEYPRFQEGQGGAGNTEEASPEAAIR